MSGPFLISGVLFFSLTALVPAGEAEVIKILPPL